MRESPEETNSATDNEQTLTISAEKVCFVVVKARDFGAKDEVTDPIQDRIQQMTAIARSSKITWTILSSKSSH
jgi:hypothetical protein